MSELDVNSVKQDILNIFGEFKDDLKEKVKQEVKGHVDALLAEKLDRMNEAITKHEDKLELTEKALAMSKAQREVGQAIEKDPLSKAFVQYLRNAEDLTSEQKQLLSQHKSMNASSDPSGGYLVLPVMSNIITKKLDETSPIRSVASVETISSDQLQIPQQTDLPAADWTDVDATQDETDAVTWRQLTIKTHGIKAAPRISQSLLDDASLDVEAYLTAALVEAFDIKMNTGYVSGTGVGQPRGFLTYTAGTSWGQIEQVVTGSAAALTAAGINNVYYALKDGYLPNAVWMMRRDTVRLIRLLVDGNGNALWTPAFGTEPAQIMGHRVVRAADMPAVTTNTLSVAFGDFRRGYKVVDTSGMRILRDPYTATPFVKFTTTARTGGAVDNYEAIKILKCST